MEIELSPTQTTLLTAACQRQDRLVFPVVAKIKGGAVGNVLKSLLAKGLIEETPATDDMTVWRYNDGETAITLRATDAAFEALGLAGATVAAEADTAPRVRQNREGTKQEGLIAMLKRPEGARIDEVCTAFGWQAHTVRGAIAGTLKRKLSLEVASEKVEGRGRVYKIAE